MNVSNKQLEKQDSRKITVTIPLEVLTQLDSHVESRGRSQFIVDAITEKLTLMEQVDALDATAGSWSDARHPELENEQAVDSWLATLRSSWNRDEPI